eukprot:jgi/Mesvir1/6077/Mv25289-RA.2
MSQMMADAKSSVVRLVLEEGVFLGDVVIVGFCDASAAGCRALMSMQSSSDTSLSAFTLRLVGVEHKQVFSRHEATECNVAVQLVNISRKINSTESTQISMIIFNASIPASRSIHVAHALLSLVEERRQGRAPPTLLVVAAMHVGHGAPTRGLCHLRLQGADHCHMQLVACDTLPALDPPTPIPDSFLASLVHLARASGQSGACVIAPGHTPRGSNRRGAPAASALEEVDALGWWLSECTGLCYAPAMARELECLSGWQDEQPDGQMIYG